MTKFRCPMDSRVFDTWRGFRTHVATHRRQHYDDWRAGLYEDPDPIRIEDDMALPENPGSRAEDLGEQLFKALKVGVVIRDLERQLVLEAIKLMVNLEDQNDKASRQAGELLTMSRKLSELFDS